MKRILDLSEVSTPQLMEIKKVLSAGVRAKAETSIAQEKSYLCHKSPPAGYPKEKADYGDPACYRYPLNTESRCLAAWRYVHQADNKAILGDKFKSVESKIRSYAKKQYNLDLQVGESDEFNWEQAFVEYYDTETMGERCDTIVLEPEESDSNSEVDIMDEKEKITALEAEVKTLKDEKESWSSEKTDLEAKASQVEALTQELTTLKTEVEALRKFKTDTEEAAQRADKIKGIKSKLDEAGIEADVETEADYWLSMTEDTLTKTIAKMSALSKGAKASASIKVPPVGGEDEPDARKVVSDALKARKQAKDK